MSFIIAIDGPAGSGKGTVTKLLADKLNYRAMDTGAMYRSCTLYFMENNVDFKDIEQVENALKNIEIDMKEIDGKLHVYLNEKDVSIDIRTAEVTANVSEVSAIPVVREVMDKQQRKLAKDANYIVEGRDIGTKVFPDAFVKIYLDATPEERANRRFKQNKEKGILNQSYEEILQAIKDRDYYDSHRDTDPLRKADDAILIDSSNMSINQVVSKIEKIVKKKNKDIKKEKRIYWERPDSKLKFFERNFFIKATHLVYKILFRIEKVGEKDIPEDGNSYIVCANHLNYFDAIGVIVTANRFVRFVCKSQMFKNSLFMWILHMGDVIPVNREKSDVESMRRSIKALKSGQVLGIFPEGTRRGMEKNIDAKDGAAFMALRTKTKVIPIGIQGSFKPFTKVKLNYGKPLDFSEYYGKEKDKEVLGRVTKEIMDNIVMLTNEKI